MMASATTSDGEARLYAAVLAAGAARRYGAAKQLAGFRGEPLAARALRAAEAVCGARSLIVTGSSGAAVYRAVAPVLGFRVHNSDFAAGLASSIAAAVAAVAHDADGILLLLADQPLVDRHHLQALANCWQRTPRQYVATAYAKQVGVPAIFPRSAFGALAALRGDSGARRLLREAGDHVTAIRCDAAAVDIDRPADLAALGDDTS